MAHMDRCGRLFEEGIALLEEIFDSLSVYRKEQARFLINVGRYIAVSCRTVVHVKEWFMLKNRLKVETDGQKLEECCRRMIQIGEAEMENAASAIPLCSTTPGWAGRPLWAMWPTSTTSAGSCGRWSGSSPRSCPGISNWHSSKRGLAGAAKGIACSACQKKGG